MFLINANKASTFLNNNQNLVSTKLPMGLTFQIHTYFDVLLAVSDIHPTLVWNFETNDFELLTIH